MKRIALVITVCCVSVSLGGNPLFFGADPSARVWQDGRMWIYLNFNEDGTIVKSAITDLGVGTLPQEKSLSDRVTGRSYPSVFQAWNPIDMETYPLETLQDRLRTAAKHDFLFEEPVSQLGYGVKLVLGAIWDHTHGGLAQGFTPKSLQQALTNRKAMLAVNPNMVFLMEVRWRDAPDSFLPVESHFWLRDKTGKRVEGWKGGPEPYYMLNYENSAFQANIARQCKAAIDSGVYDGVMLDWSGFLPIVKKVRHAIQRSGLIIVNIHDNIKDGEAYKDYINGSFMECNLKDETSPKTSFYTDWEALRQGLMYFETHFQEPRTNCLEVWGDRTDVKRMRAATCLGLTHSNGYVLFADPNPLTTPDHLHDWYDFWDVDLGAPSGERVDRPDGAYERAFEHGKVVYNPQGNDTIVVAFPNQHKQQSTGKVGTRFELSKIDGDIFVPVK